MTKTGVGGCRSGGRRLIELGLCLLAVILLLALLIVLWNGWRSEVEAERELASRRPALEEFQHSTADSVSHGKRPLEPRLPDDSRKKDAESTWELWKSNILPTNGGDLEHVILAKTNQNSYEDPPDENSNAERHHSGHFRHSENNVWDPHPQYEFSAFGRRFHLTLKEDSSFASPAVTVTHISGNSSKHESYPDRHLGCFYTGFVEGDPKSAVSVSLCHGMTGHMRTSTGNYFIKPTQSWSDNEKLAVGSPLEHDIYRLKSKSTASVSNGSLESIAAETTNRSLNDLPVDDDILTDYDVANKTQRECGLIDNNEDRESGQLTEIAVDDASLDPVKMYVGSDDPMHHRSEAGLGYDGSSASWKLRRRRKRAATYSRDSKVAAEEDDDEDDRSFALQEAGSGVAGSSDRSGWDVDAYGQWRPRRALPREYFIEIMVVADAKMIDYHGSSLNNYILVLMNTVSRIYKDPSIGNPISIAVIKIKKIDEIFGVKQRDSDGIGAGEMLRKFCHWQKLNNPHEPSPEHHDAALLLTRENLCHNPGEKRCDTLGLAELGRMCSIGSSCAIVQDNGLATAFTIAHEIGHVLNMPHDDDPKCTRFRDRSGVHNIMSRMLDDNTIPWEWSKCSRHFVTEFLDAGQGNCLLDEPSQDSKYMSRSPSNRLPGEDYSENKQCELVYGAGSEICPHMVSDVCKRLWCTVPYWDDRSEQCHTQHMPWADGTVCGPGKWCHRGECVSREMLKPVDGQWGEWSSYGECSRTCGGGIKKKYRECDSPAPKNGGNYCVGERVRYRSCGTRECPPGSVDFREEQCNEFNNDNRNIRNLAKNVKWHAKYNRILPEDKCKLYCQVAGNQYYMLRDKVVDGTPCGPDTFHVCVNGHCKPAGCDHMLNSTASLDTCGVCRGDNSTCQRISGSFNSSEYGYNRITKIPSGSSYIDVRQYGWKGSHNDSNYLALRLEEGGRYILNGNFSVMHRKVIIHPGVTIEYSGPEQIVERLNSSRPTQVDLVLEVLSVGNVNPPQISYEYTVPKKLLDRFSWILSEWTRCSRMCKGTTHRRALCQAQDERKDIMSDDYCSAEDKPREESRSCNDHCELQWQEVPNSRTECSSHCGPGWQQVRLRCVAVMHHTSDNGVSLSSAHQRQAMPAHACAHLERPSERRPCEGPCEAAHWAYGEWSACSATCGDSGIQYRTASCVDSEGRLLPEHLCPVVARITQQPCNHVSCPTWDYAEWSNCSVSCGTGKRERKHWCRIDNRVVQPNYCNGLPALTTEPCDAGPCDAWQTGDWGPCTASCGEGIRRRLVICKYTNGSISKNCNPAEKPITFISCSHKSCPTETTTVPSMTYSPKPHFVLDDLSSHENDVDSHRITFRSGYTWEIEGFEECSKSCGGGYANQIIKCISVETGKPAPNKHYCDLKRRPQDTITCNEHQCPDWTVGEWSQCDVKCGDGYQERQVLCQDSRGELMNESDCSEKSRPRHLKKCQRAPCAPHSDSDSLQNHNSYKWISGPWSECSASCGTGLRHREVSCHRVNAFGWHDPSPSPSELCSTPTTHSHHHHNHLHSQPLHHPPQHEHHSTTPEQRPPSEQICRSRGCNDPFYWLPGPWRKCSHPCGRRGRQQRRLFCVDRVTGRKVRRKQCPVAIRPPRRRKCNQKPCTGPTSCRDLQQRLRVYEDGEYTMLVGGRYMQIYCDGMEGSEPTEYLSLPSGERENYAEIYDRRLRDPYTCPHEGRRNDSCNCNVGSVTIAGRTMFQKIRINVSTLHVLVDDFKFSTKVGENNIEYGKAGDCYSHLDCPQGRFGINLSGTLLMLSPDVHWPKQRNSYSSINKINNQRVIGRCGGYCGVCTPSPSLKLNVLLT